MRCAYINLESATARRERIEASFAAAGTTGLTLERFPAITAETATSHPGTIPAAQRACYLSHLALIESSLSDPADLFVLEDDAAFGRATFQVLGSLLAAPEPWDILFTDVGFWQPGEVIELAKLREQLAAAGSYRLLDIGRTQFFGTSAYVVRGSSKAKVLAALKQADGINHPIDLYMRGLARTGALKVMTCLPFLTTLSPDAEVSQASTADTAFDRAVNTFRRAMFAERDLSACDAAADGLVAELCGPAELLVGKLLAVQASPRFNLKR